MTTTINYFGRMLCAFLLCTGMVMTSCESEGPIDNGENTEQGGNQETPEPEAPATITLGNVTYNSATFTGHLNVAASDLSFSQVTIYYSDAETFNMNAAESVSVISFDKEQNFTVTLADLKMNTKYNYCMVMEVKSEKTFGDVLEFTTLPHPYDVLHELITSSASDLSSAGAANCYIVSSEGLYKFKAVKGNSSESVGSVVSASILWETFGTSEVPEFFDLLKAVCYKDGYVVFQTADSFREGNAVIAAKDNNGNILWSWHIWMTDQPEGQVYYNNAGTMMDRHLGATSATPGDVGALGLFYQWGRKDPFLGKSSIFESIRAESTITWPSPVTTDSSIGTIEYATAYPTTFIRSSEDETDWFYCTDLWTTEPKDRWHRSNMAKSIYDPCPAGWRVPDGSVWGDALGTNSLNYTPDLTNNGFDFSGKLGSATTIWYPATGWYDHASSGSDLVTSHIWSAFSHQLNNVSYILEFYVDDAYVHALNDKATEYNSSGLPVRCIKETE